MATRLYLRALTPTGGTADTSRYYYYTQSNAWGTISSLNVARYGIYGCGTTAATLCFGGNADGAAVGNTELWNGASWDTVGGLNTARYHPAGAGTASSAIAFGGFSTGTENVTESWNGSAWSAANPLNTARYLPAGCGSASAALAIAGNAGGVTTSVESWNGSSWSATTAISVAKAGLAGCGTTSSAIAFGGSISGGAASASTESWNGAAWSATGNLNTARSGLAASGDASTARCFGGAAVSTPSNTAESWNGSAWSAANGLNAAVWYNAGCGSATAAISAGGYRTGSVRTAAAEIYPGSPRYYFESSTYPTGEQSGSTANFSVTHTVRSLLPYKGSSQTSVSQTSAATASAQYGYFSQWVSPAIMTVNGGLTFDGTISVGVADAQGLGATNFWINNVEVYVWRPSTNSKVGTLYSVAAASQGGLEAPGGGTGEYTTLFGPLTLSGVTIQAGDQVVVEFWAYFTQAMSTSTSTCSLYYDGTVDPSAENTSTADAASWVEFSRDMTWYAPALAQKFVTPTSQRFYAVAQSNTW